MIVTSAALCTQKAAVLAYQRVWVTGLSMRHKAQTMVSVPATRLSQTAIVDTDIGADSVMDTLGRIEHGVFA